MKKIWLIRHGESIANAGQPTQDHSMIPLSPLGIKQAQDLALTITEKPDLIVTSPYLRAQQTACRLLGGFPACLRAFGIVSMNSCI